MDLVIKLIYIIKHYQGWGLVIYRFKFSVYAKDRSEFVQGRPTTGVFTKLCNLIRLIESI